MLTSSNRLYAGFFVRAAAFLIDNALVGIAVLFVRFIAFFIRLFGGGLPNILFNFDIVDILCYLLVTFYFVIFTGLTGSTLGKKALQIEVIKGDDSRLSFFDALYRETIGRYLNGILFIGYIVAACDRRKRSFSDMLSNTYVVYSFKMANDHNVTLGNLN